LLRRSQLIEEQLQSAKQELRSGVSGMLEDSDSYTVIAKLVSSEKVGNAIVDLAFVETIE
jgi:hypothetical protein